MIYLTRDEFCDIIEIWDKKPEWELKDRGWWLDGVRPLCKISLKACREIFEIEIEEANGIIIEVQVDFHDRFQSYKMLDAL